MPQIRVLGKGAQIAGGVFCLLFALQTWSWVAYDIAEFGLPTTWDIWSHAVNPDRLPTAIPVTTANDLGLGALQVAAAFAALSRARLSGGMLATAAALTAGYRLPVLWQGVIGNPTVPFYAGPGFKDDDTVLGICWGTCLLVILLSLLLGIVLAASNTTWPPVPRPGAQPPVPGDPPQRPTPPGAAVAASFLGAIAVLNIVWLLYTAVQSGVGALFLSGESFLYSVHAVPSSWALLLETVVCGVGALLALNRRISARGYSLGVTLLVLPVTVVNVVQMITSGELFDFTASGTGYAVLLHLQLLVMLAGGIAVAVLTAKPGVPVQPGPHPQFAQPPFGQPQFGQQPFGQQPFGQQPFGQPAGAPQVPPQQPPYAPQQPVQPPAGAPAPGYGFPPQPSQPPQQSPQQPPAGGGFGPPPSA